MRPWPPSRFSALRLVLGLQAALPHPPHNLPFASEFCLRNSAPWALPSADKAPGPREMAAPGVPPPSKSRGGPWCRDPQEERKGPAKTGRRGPHLPFGFGDLFVEGFFCVSDPQHGGLQLSGHLQGEGRASVTKAFPWWGHPRPPTQRLPVSAPAAGALVGDHCMCTCRLGAPCGLLAHTRGRHVLLVDPQP